jgi:hypothetical protein
MATSSPFPPSAGEGWDGGEEALASPPPEPSPIKGEGMYGMEGCGKVANSPLLEQAEIFEGHL